MTPNKNPVYNLKAVLQETGIAADTLRAWERRYGLPLPQRTAGGHRLYSAYDIETIKWLIARQAEGLSISRAVDMWNEQTASGTDPLAGTALRPTHTAESAALALTRETHLDALRAAWLGACLNFNEADAEQSLNQAFALYPVEVVCSELLQRGLTEMGARWYENRATVQQEHFASALATRRLENLISASPPPIRTENLIVGCPPNEWHTFTPLLLSLLLRRQGYHVVYLGANVPAEQFDETVRAVKAHLVILIAQQLTTAFTLMEAAHRLSGRHTRVAFGGRIFTMHPDLRPRIPGHYLGDTLEASLSGIQSLLAKPARQASTPPADEAHGRAAHAFHLHRNQVETYVVNSSDRLGLEPGVVRNAIDFMGENLHAALQLGRITFLNEEVEWVRALLNASQIHENSLVDFIRLYGEAVDYHLNGAGALISNWLKDREAVLNG